MQFLTTEDKIKRLEQSNKSLREQLIDANYRINGLRKDVHALYKPIIDEKVKAIEAMQAKMREMQEEYLRIIEKKDMDNAPLHHQNKEGQPVFLR